MLSRVAEQLNEWVDVNQRDSPFIVNVFRSNIPSIKNVPQTQSNCPSVDLKCTHRDYPFILSTPLGEAKLV